MALLEIYIPLKKKAGIIAVTGMSAALLFISGCTERSATTARAPGAPPEVSVVVVKPQSVALTTELAGRTAAYLIAEVRPQVSGIIKRRLFTEGAKVKEGEVLYQIDPATYQASFNSAKAALDRSEANLTPARLKAERYVDLVKINAVSQQDYDDASAALKQAEADVEAAKAALEFARINLTYTKVTAPISGWVGRSSVTNGALVTADQPTALATIQQLSPIYVDVTKSSADLLRLKRERASGLLKSSGSSQARVKLLLEDGSTYPLPGTLKFSEVTVDQGTGSVTMRAVFPNPKQTLLPGMFVRAEVEEGVNEHAILVPQRGVSRNTSGDATVMVVGREEKAEPRVIKVARTVGDYWLVSDGLKAGDRVIIEGLEKVRPGTPVKAVAFASKGNSAPAGPVKAEEAKE